MSLKQKTISNIKWSFIESISLKAISFVLGIILARLLLPADFGLLAVVNVFYLLVTLFIDGGLKEALIQKKNATDVDYSTVFWVNIIISILLYLVLFIAAPFIEKFYEYNHLAFYIRLQSLTLIIESFGIVQVAKATKELSLKKVTKARIPASLISFAVGIYLAYHGYGILSLVIQQLVNNFLYILFLVINVRYKPYFVFSLESIKGLYKFGLKVLMASLISRFYVQSLNLIYAKFYSPQLLGLNNKAGTIQSTPIEIINSTFMKGVYPTYVILQDDIQKLRNLYFFNIRLLIFLMLLINGLFFFTAKELIVLVLGEKWSESAIYLKIIASGSLLYPITVQSQNIFKVRNKLNAFLRLESINKLLSLFLIILLVNFLNFSVLLMVIVGVNFLFAIICLGMIAAELKFSFLREIYRISSKMMIFVLLGIILQAASKLFEINNMSYLIFFSILYFGIWLFYLFIFERDLILKIKNNITNNQGKK